MRRAIGFLPVVAALSLGCDVDLSGLDLSGLDDWTLPPAPVLNVTLAPDSLRLKVGEAAEIRETGGLNVRWSSRDSTIARPDPNAEWKSTAEVTALHPGETWIIGYLVLQPPDSIWVVVE